MLVVSPDASRLVGELRSLGVRCRVSRSAISLYTHTRLSALRTIAAQSVAVLRQPSYMVPSLHSMRRRHVSLYELPELKQSDAGPVGMPSETTYNAYVWLYVTTIAGDARVDDQGHVWFTRTSDTRRRVRSSWRWLRWINGSCPDPWQATLDKFSPQHWAAMKRWAQREYLYTDTATVRRAGNDFPFSDDVMVREHVLSAHLLYPKQQLGWQELQHYLSKYLPHWSRLSHLHLSFTSDPFLGSPFERLYKREAQSQPQFPRSTFPLRSWGELESTTDYPLMDSSWKRVSRIPGRWSHEMAAVAAFPVQQVAVGDEFEEFYAEVHYSRQQLNAAIGMDEVLPYRMQQPNIQRWNRQSSMPAPPRPGAAFMDNRVALADFC